MCSIFVNLLERDQFEGGLHLCFTSQVSEKQQGFISYNLSYRLTISIKRRKVTRAFISKKQELTNHHIFKFSQFSRNMDRITEEVDNVSDLTIHKHIHKTGNTTRNGKNCFL